MKAKEELEMWGKLHPQEIKGRTIYDERLEKLSDRLAHFDSARNFIESWPKWKREAADSMYPSDRYFETDSGARHRI